jgi:hypothetical protein
VVPIRPGLTARYGDTQAMNDIHALLTGVARLAGAEAAACVAEIVARTGRRLDPARLISAEVTSDRHGMPVARVDADGTVILVGQNLCGPGALVRVTTRNAAEAVGWSSPLTAAPCATPPCVPSALPDRDGRGSPRAGP